MPKDDWSDDERYYCQKKFQEFDYSSGTEGWNPDDTTSTYIISVGCGDPVVGRFASHMNGGDAKNKNDQKLFRNYRKAANRFVTRLPKEWINDPEFFSGENEKFADKYEFVIEGTILASGKFGDVYLAKAKNMEYSFVAITVPKVNDNKNAIAAAEFTMKEVRIWKIIAKFPYVLSLLDDSIRPNVNGLPVVCTVSPCVPHRTLWHYMTANQAGLPPSEAWLVAIQLMLAGDYMKACKVYHQHIKPDNILVETNCSGLSKILLRDIGTVRRFAKTRPEEWHITGTDRFFTAPEILQKEECELEMVDTYSIGRTIIVTTVGNVPIKSSGCNWSDEKESTMEQVFRDNNEKPLLKIAIDMTEEDPAMRCTLSDALGQTISLCPSEANFSEAHDEDFVKALDMIAKKRRISYFQPLLKPPWRGSSESGESRQQPARDFIENIGDVMKDSKMSFGQQELKKARNSDDLKKHVTQSTSIVQSTLQSSPVFTTRPLADHYRSDYGALPETSTISADWSTNGQIPQLAAMTCQTSVAQQSQSNSIIQNPSFQTQAQMLHHQPQLLQAQMLHQQPQLLQAQMLHQQPQLLQAQMLHQQPQLLQTQMLHQQLQLLQAQMLHQQQQSHNDHRQADSQVAASDASTILARNNDDLKKPVVDTSHGVKNHVTKSPSKVQGTIQSSAGFKTRPLADHSQNEQCSSPFFPKKVDPALTEMLKAYPLGANSWSGLLGETEDILEKYPNQYICLLGGTIHSESKKQIVQEVVDAFIAPAGTSLPTCVDIRLIGGDKSFSFSQLGMEWRPVGPSRNLFLLAFVGNSPSNFLNVFKEQAAIDGAFVKTDWFMKSWEKVPILPRGAS